ncbi:hypothetical protein [Sporocytophaga myxococcoides]|uniref:hypothetical protein n=1 Tax=Sporocytophaga myxococcoides TaxID=153721 RepID=UPI0012DE005B|nr:hypothetical protein [Sporocytophaga myxococcoides]
MGIYKFVSGNMSASPKHNISIERAIDLINDGKPLKDFYVDGELKIHTFETWDKEVVLENCIIDSFSGSMIQFDKPVRLMNCHFKNCQFISSYFLRGLTIENCTFDGYLDFQAGGHNKPRNVVIITNNEFNDFVNFFDCWYESDVTILDNKFHKGTNLLGKPFNIPVTFDVVPIIKNNIGKLDFDNEVERSDDE